MPLICRKHVLNGWKSDVGADRPNNPAFKVITTVMWACSFTLGYWRRRINHLLPDLGNDEHQAGGHETRQHDCNEGYKRAACHIATAAYNVTLLQIILVGLKILRKLQAVFVCLTVRGCSSATVLLIFSVVFFFIYFFYIIFNLIFLIWFNGGVKCYRPVILFACCQIQDRQGWRVPVFTLFFAIFLSRRNQYGVRPVVRYVLGDIRLR